MHLQFLVILKNGFIVVSENISNSGLIPYEVIDKAFASGSANNAAPKKCSVHIQQTVFVKSLRDGINKMMGCINEWLQMGER